MNRKYLLAAGILAAITILYFSLQTGDESIEATAKVVRGNLSVSVKTTGELRAKESEKF